MGSSPNRQDIGDCQNQRYIWESQHCSDFLAHSSLPDLPGIHAVKYPVACDQVGRQVRLGSCSSGLLHTPACSGCQACPAPAVLSAPPLVCRLPAHSLPKGCLRPAVRGGAWEACCVCGTRPVRPGALLQVVCSIALLSWKEQLVDSACPACTHKTYVCACVSVM